MPDQETRNYFGLRVRQRDAETAPQQFAFYASASDVSGWVGVRHSADMDEGIQRMLKPSRKRAISRFVASEETNTIPNSILIAFKSGVASFEEVLCRAVDDVSNGCNERLAWGRLTFAFDPGVPDEERAAMVVDGQHRLRGLAAYAEESGEDLPLLVVALLDADVQEQAFQFVVINNKAVRVPTDNVKSIIAGIDEDALVERLYKAGVRYGSSSPILRDLNDLDESPFKNLLKWDYNKAEGGQLVPLTALEQMLRQMRVEFPFLEEDEDTLLFAFFAIWRAVASCYPEIWGKEGKLMTKVGLAATNEFLTQRLKGYWEDGIVDLYDPDSIEPHVIKIMNRVPEDFWMSEWTIGKVQDNANVRLLIRRDLATIRNNMQLRHPWYHDLKLVAPPSEAEDQSQAEE
jgi:DGQHR domain-containing protein